MNTHYFMPVGEYLMREALRRKLDETTPGGSTLREEMAVGSVWIDFACIGDRLDGFEMKSDSDGLSRLPKQVAEYGRFFDTMTLVVGKALYFVGPAKPLHPA